MVYTGNDVRVLLSPCGVLVVFETSWGVQRLSGICAVLIVVPSIAQQKLVERQGGESAKIRVVQALASKGHDCVHIPYN